MQTATNLREVWEQYGLAWINLVVCL